MSPVLVEVGPTRSRFISNGTSLKINVLYGKPVVGITCNLAEVYTVSLAHFFDYAGGTVIRDTTYC